MSPKVSVVVPVYKVERYLRRCLDSILHQTYKNIEIILVNDGSPDSCSEIIEEYAQKDHRIQPLHKENGGLSDARNFGMKHVTGDYTLFVDSDDWLDHRMIEEMVVNSINFEADIVQSAFYYAHEDHLLFDNRYYSKDETPILLDNKNLMKELVINEKVKNFAWGKLYKTSLIRDIPFKKGALFEDVFWAHHVMHRVEKYVILHQPRYYYYQRNDSIVATYTPRNLDILEGLRERHIFIERFYKELINDSYKNILKTSLMHYNLLFLNRKRDKRGLHRKRIQRYIKVNYREMKRAIQDDQFLKIQLFLFYINPLFNLLFLAFVKAKRIVYVNHKQQEFLRINL